MKKWLLPILCLLLLLSGCAPKEKETEFFAMDTIMKLRILGDTDSEALTKQVVQEIGALEQALSVTLPSSDVARLNNGEALTPRPEVLSLLRQTLSLSQRTEGCLDPTIYPIVRLWGFTTGEYQVPTPEQRAQALALTGRSHIQQDGDTVWLTDGAELDFGAVAKGYAADRCAALLNEAGSAAILSLGGNVHTVGSKPDGSDWQIGITDPAQPEQNAAVLTLSGSHAVVTSGGYQRYFEENGVRYSHIMDPATGASADAGLCSVTIVADSGLLADGLSTALYVMGPERAAAFWRASDDFELVLITDDGTMLVSEGLSEHCTSSRQIQVIRK